MTGLLNPKSSEILGNFFSFSSFGNDFFVVYLNHWGFFIRCRNFDFFPNQFLGEVCLKFLNGITLEKKWCTSIIVARALNKTKCKKMTNKTPWSLGYTR